jgi:hypothetical protein
MAESNIKAKLKRWRNLAILRIMPPCKEIVQIVSASLDRPLTLNEKFKMKLHLAACRPCVRYFEQSKFLKEATHALDEDGKEDLFAGKLSDDARNRIKEALKASAPVLAIFLISFIFEI